MASTIAVVVGGLLTVPGAAAGAVPLAGADVAGALVDDGLPHAVTTNDTATTAVT
jgi:hypothetical protein